MDLYFIVNILHVFRCQRRRDLISRIVSAKTCTQNRKSLISQCGCTSSQECQKIPNSTRKQEKRSGYKFLFYILFPEINLQHCVSDLALLSLQNIEWFPIEKLPCHRNDMTPKSKLGLAPNRFFMAIPFIRSV